MRAGEKLLSPALSVSIIYLTGGQMFKPTKKKTDLSEFKPKKKKKKTLHITHNFKIGQRVKIMAEHREQYLCFHNKDGTLNNPTYEILSFHKYGGVMIMNLKDP